MYFFIIQKSLEEKYFWTETIIQKFISSDHIMMQNMYSEHGYYTT